MSNYAYSPQRRYETQPFANWAQNLDPIGRTMFDMQPDNSMEMWLSYLNPTQLDDNMLRKLYSRLYTGYESRQLADPTGKNTPELSFVDYLSRKDPNKELARYSPAARNAEQRGYTRPARWVAF